MRSFLILAILTMGLQALAQDPVADRMLLYQRSYGGWPKHIKEVKLDYTKSLTDQQQAEVKKQIDWKDGTIDNNATTREIRYLLEAADKTGNADYRAAAVRGIEYLLRMQYANGGFPQFWPDTAIYRAQITYNDNAMINALKVLKDVTKDSSFDVSLRTRSAVAVEKGIDCIVKSQYIRNGERTVWCAQVDRFNLQPVKARAFELASLSGAESVSIVKFLMEQPKPSKEVEESIRAAVKWFERNAIRDSSYEWVTNPATGQKDHVLQSAPGSRVWARFYTLENDQPFVCGRDGIKQASVMNIEAERRNGYAWYGPWAESLLVKDLAGWENKRKKATLQSKQ